MHLPVSRDYVIITQMGDVKFMKGKEKMKKNMLKNFRSGFSLSELIVVIAILAFLTALSIPAYQAVRERMATRACNQNKYIIWKTYKNEHQLDNSVTLEDVILDRYSPTGNPADEKSGIFFIDKPVCDEAEKKLGHDAGAYYYSGDPVNPQLSDICCPIHDAP